MYEVHTDHLAMEVSNFSCLFTILYMPESGIRLFLDLCEGNTLMAGRAGVGRSHGVTGMTRVASFLVLMLRLLMRPIGTRLGLATLF